MISIDRGTFIPVQSIIKGLIDKDDDNFAIGQKLCV